MEERAEKKRWYLTVHALSRAASRFKIMMDRQLQTEVSRILDSNQATFVTENNGSQLYEIPLLGIKLIAVCNVQERVVVTFLEPDRWYRTHMGRRRKYVRPETGKWDEEE